MKIKNLVACVMLQTAVISSIYSMEDESEVNNNILHNINNLRSTNIVVSDTDKKLNLNKIDDNIDNIHSAENREKPKNISRLKKKRLNKFSKFKDLREVKTYNKLFWYRTNAKDCCIQVTLKKFAKSGIHYDGKLINAIHINNHDYIILRNTGSSSTEHPFYYYALDSDKLFDSIENLLSDNMPISERYDIQYDTDNLYNTNTFYSIINSYILGKPISQFIDAIKSSNSENSTYRNIIVNNERCGEISRSFFGELCAAENYDQVISIQDNACLLYRIRYKYNNKMHSAYFILNNTKQGEKKYFLVRDLETDHYYFMLVNNKNERTFFRNITDIVNNNKVNLELEYDYYEYIDDKLLDDFLKKRKISYNAFVWTEDDNDNIKDDNKLINNINNNEKSENKINREIINNKDIQVVNPTYIQNEINNNNFSENNNDIINNKNISNIIKNNTNKDSINAIKIEEFKSKLDDKSIKDKNNINEINIVESEPRINDKVITNDKENINNTSVNHNNNMKDNTIEQNKDLNFENLTEIMRKPNKTKSKIGTVDEFLTKLSKDNEYKKQLRDSLASLKSKDDRSIYKFLTEEVFKGKDISITPKICQAIIAYFDLLPQKLEKK